MSASVRCELRGFGPIGELLEKSGEPVRAVMLPTPAPVSELRRLLLAAIPGLDAFRFRIVVNRTMPGEADEVQLDEGAEVALFPPFAGG